MQSNSSPSINLNLARKWRSKDFDHIVGQELSVRILKNSLYLNQFFPVYLFSGQRGCGKTSTARVFAAAVNCMNIQNFQQNPKTFSLPCRTCASCLAMERNNHPDFIEIDAASHTGVDNVRQIIEASTLLPLLGRKKIYLIDEAHMLSKAAFNAFLKILEEPPASVLFILATTDPEKIIDTVRSRCFQLFFSAIKQDLLVQHLINVCMQEQLAYEENGLALIVQEVQGSARDALNLLEQVRFSHACINQTAVQAVLGHPQEAQLIGLFERLIVGDSPDSFLQFLQEINFSTISPVFIWHKLLALVRVAFYVHYNVELANTEYAQQMGKMRGQLSIVRLIAISEQLYEQELMFTKTIHKSLFLEMLLVKLACSLQTEPDKLTERKQLPPRVNPEPQEVAVVHNQNPVEHKAGTSQSRWESFLIKIQTLNDPLVLSVFKQATFQEYNKDKATVHVEFPKTFAFFKDLLEETRPSWLPLMEEVFEQKVALMSVLSTQEPIKSTEKKTPQIVSPKQEIRASNTQQQKNYSYPVQKKTFASPVSKGQSFDVSDKARWKLANELLEAFPGKIQQIGENK